MDERWQKVLSKTQECFVAIPGSRFGSSVVIMCELGKEGKARLQCDCGTIYEVRRLTLRNGTSNRRCLRCATAGVIELIANRQRAVITDSKIRSSWRGRRNGMISRCYDPENPAYPDYGGRGITVYRPWIEDSDEWLRFVTTLEGWQNTKLFVDRIDNDKGYYPENIRLTTRKTNNNNKRNHRWVCLEENKYNAQQFRDVFTPKWSRSSVMRRLNKGLNAERILMDYNKYLDKSEKPANLNP